MRDWWSNPRLPMSRVTWLRLSWLLIVASIIGWPASAMTFAAEEPPMILFLSWLAVFLGALATLVTVDVRAEQDKK